MDDVVNWFVSVGDAPYGEAIELAGILGFSWLVHVVTRRWAARLIERVVRNSQIQWDDALHDAKVFERTVAVVPVFVAWQAINILEVARGGDAEASDFSAFATRLVLAAAIFCVVRVLLALISAGNAIYTGMPENRNRPIEGYVQVVKIAISVVATILIIAALADESPVIFLSGLGAMTAVLLLVFRDTILSLVASVQISGNDMVRVGDWIEMPQFGADGDVTDVALHTVKVQNWDKTITTIPTHRLISDPFKNWRYMSLSGGRRIKRALFIDVSSVRFLEDGEIERFGEFRLLRDYVAKKREEMAIFNQDPQRSKSIDADIRRLTNLGTYRAYMERYLESHPKIHKEMTLIVRQLAPTSEGIPLEIYCFTTTTDWKEYEGIQADLFDHFIALAPQFGLRVFQTPTGADLAALSGR